MAIPDYETLMRPILQLHADNQEHARSVIVTKVAEIFQLTEAELAETLPKSKRRLIDDRVHWAILYMVKAGLLVRTGRGITQITDRGHTVLAQYPSALNDGILQQFPEFKEFKQRNRGSLENTVPDPTAEVDNHVPAALQTFRENLERTRAFVYGGNRLKELGVTAFDVDELFRGAWIQAVAYHEQWVKQEIVDRAVAIAEDSTRPRPAKFQKLKISVAQFEKIHHDRQSIAKIFRAHLEDHFGRESFLRPSQIKEGFAHVSSIDLWQEVASIRSAGVAGDAAVKVPELHARLNEIAERRNQIAHAADHDPQSAGKLLPISGEDVLDVIDWLDANAVAIVQAIDGHHA
ncbi:winged helix-turn-helix domain-containing protein [Microbispora sp. NPDC088329]|uniref:winged helix-turn-helix domain-containing protein n=1 Tax=Microbispora sp. NPDC088329 TaxID=3154869 RepID=UPI00341B4C86